MNFKQLERRDEWWNLHPKLRLILCDMDLWLFGRGVQMVITCMIRSDEEQAELVRTGASKFKMSVHQVGRGADIRQPLDPGVCEQLAQYINTKYPYDPNRPGLTTLLWHGEVPHGHVQVME